MFADLIDGPLAHLPSGRFGANSAWALCAAIAHNLLHTAGTLAGRPHTRARGATLRSVRFSDCSINELNVTEARLTKVDLSGARLRSLIGVDNLRGAIINRGQLLDLAPQLAAQLGVEVRPDDPEADG